MNRTSTLKKLLALMLSLLMLASVAAIPVSAASAPAAPSKITVSRTTTSLKLTWPKVKGATGYRIYYRLPGDLSWRKIVSSTTKTSYTFKDLSYGQSYKFAVRSYTKSGSKTLWSGYKEIATATKTSTPKKFYVDKATTSALKLRWSNLDEADGYKLYYRTSTSAKWKTLVSSTKSNRYTVRGLSAGKKYYFAVKAYVKSEFGTFYGDARYLETATKPATLTVKATASTSYIKLSWNKVSADGYRIYYKSGSSWKTAVKSTTATSCTIKNLTAGKTYKFAVRPYVKTASGTVWGGYKELSVTTKSTAGNVPSTKKEIASAYNKAINDAKAYTGKVTLKKHDIINTQLKDLPAIAEKILVPVLENLTATEPRKWTFKNGVDVSDNTRRLADKITPYGRNASLRSAGIASASATANKDGGYTLKITLVAEDSTFDGTNNIVEPPYHKGVLNPLNLGTLDLGPITVTYAEFYYPGATLTATVDGQGRLTKLYHYLPIEGVFEGKAGISLIINMEMSMDSYYELIYA